MTNPNLQQIPKAEENSQEGVLAVRKAVKDLFTVESGCALIAIDYKVNEVRWAGILARDPELARMFNEAAQLLMEARRTGNLDQIKAAELMEDVHRAVAASMFGTPLDQVTKKQRQVSKAITFGILFQQTASALAEAQGITKEQAEAYMAQYFAKMQAVERLIRELKQFAETYGYVEAPHGRRRRFWSFALPQSDPYRRGRVARSLRQCVNSPVQGIASDSAMGGGAAILLDYIEAHQLPWVIRCVVHDSCLVQVPVQDVAKAIQLAESIFVHDAMRFMEQMGVQFNFPLGIDVEVGIEWGSTEKWNGTEQHAIELQKTVTDYWNT
jgi:DNA polymerase-1